MSSPWEVRFSNSKKLPYFYNSQTQESTWEPPSEIQTEEQLLSLRGAKEHLRHAAGSGGRGSSSGGAAGQVRASHLLIKHAQSRRPASWKSSNITLPKAEAIKILQQHLGYLRSVPNSDLPKEFAELASRESDCSSHSKGGDLGWFGRGQMQRPFEDATYGLQVGQFSDIIDTDSGVHVILRTG